MIPFQLRKGQVKESQVLNILSQYSNVNLCKVSVVEFDLSDPCSGIFWQKLLYLLPVKVSTQDVESFRGNVGQADTIA